MRLRTLLIASVLVALGSTAQSQVSTPTLISISPNRNTADASATLAATVNPALTITTPLPAATAGIAYSLTLTTTDGILPCTWSVTSGTLPPGLVLSAAGLLNGTPIQSGVFNFTVSVVDNFGELASGSFSLTVNAATLTITTASALSGATSGTAYLQTFAVAGGISPYAWTVQSGSLPAGLSLSTDGVLSGTPAQGGTFDFTVAVADRSGGSASKACILVVILPRTPTVSVTGLSDIQSPAQQPEFDIQLSAAYSIDITGFVTLTFEPNAVNSSDDPAIQFSTGGRVLDFTIPAGQTNPSWASPPAFQTGTVAGLIKLRPTFWAGGQNLTPTVGPVRALTVARAAPQVDSVQIVTTTGGFDVVVTGYSTPRQITYANFTFTTVQGNTKLGTVSVEEAFTTWYSDESATQHGSAFLYTQPFTVEGNVSDIASISVTLSNATDTSSEASTSF